MLPGKLKCVSFNMGVKNLCLCSAAFHCLTCSYTVSRRSFHNLLWHWGSKSASSYAILVEHTALIFHHFRGASILFALLLGALRSAQVELQLSLNLALSRSFTVRSNINALPKYKAFLAVLKLKSLRIRIALLWYLIRLLILMRQSCSSCG